MVYYRGCLLLPLLLLSLFRTAFTRPTPEEEEEDYLKSTCENYDGRAQVFTKWAEEEQNAKSAAKCRQLLEDELGKSLGEAGAPSVQELHFLDAGCGSGRDLAGFYDEMVNINRGSTKDTVPIQAEGFDCSKGLIDKARIRGLNVTVADFNGYLAKLPADKKFDAVFSLAALFHLPEKDMSKALKGFYNHLNDRGVILTTVPEGDFEGKGGDGRWITTLPGDKQKRMMEDAGFDVTVQKKLDSTLYYGNQWIVLVGRKKL